MLTPSTAQAAQPLRPGTAVSVADPVSTTAATRRVSGQGLITVEQARQMHLSSDHATTITMPTGGRVVVTPFATGAKPTVAPIGGIGKGGASPSWKKKTKWWGWWCVWFNKAETRRLGYGAATCATLVGRVPALGWVLAAACGILGIQARWAMDHGRCLYVTGFGATTPGVGTYRGGYCR